jgi:hypothetical protein
MVGVAALVGAAALAMSVVGLSHLVRGHRDPSSVLGASPSPGVFHTSSGGSETGGPGTAGPGTAGPETAVPDRSTSPPAGIVSVPEPANADGAPGAPGAITAALSDRGTEILVTLQWTAADGHGHPVTGYSVRLFHSGDFDLSAQVGSTSATFHVPCGGTGCVDHPFVASASVRASTVSGTGPERADAFSGDLPLAALTCSGDQASEVLCFDTQSVTGYRVDWVVDGATPPLSANAASIVVPCSGVPVHTIALTVTNGAGTAVRTYTTNALDCR